MGLKFKDIKDWKPSSISIVDSPSHPLAVFEVYENDEEFIKKYSPTIEVDNLSNEEKTIVEETENVTMSSSFFERLISGLISKSEPIEEPQDEPKKEDGDEDSKLDKILAKVESVEEKVNTIESSFDERLKKLENPEEPKKEEESDETVVDDEKTKTMVKKSEEEETEEEEESDETVVDENKTKTMVKKSQEIDPDLSNTGTGSEMTFMERIGRSEDGMKW